MAITLDHVNVEDEPGLYRVLSSSSTVYYVDTRGVDDGRRPTFMRARGSGSTGAGRHDDEWESMANLQSLPRSEELEDAPAGTAIEALAKSWLLRVGHRHEFTGKTFGYLSGEEFWWVQRKCLRIERLNEMLPREQWTVEEQAHEDDPAF